MTVDELIKTLQELSLQGSGNVDIVIGDVGRVANIASVQKRTLAYGSYKLPNVKEVVCLYHN